MPGKYQIGQANRQGRLLSSLGASGCASKSRMHILAIVTTGHYAPTRRRDSVCNQSSRLSLSPVISLRRLAIAVVSSMMLLAMNPVLYVSLVAGFSSARNRPALLDLIEVGLLAVGAGPTLDFAGATAFSSPGSRPG